MDSQFTSKAGLNMAAELQRNRKLTPGHQTLKDILGQESGPPKLDTETGMPVAGKYMTNGQEENAPRASGTLQEQEQRQEQERRQQPGEGKQGPRVS